ncbi:MAG: AsmA-like C-terminal region-containing protein [Rhodospirillales bacterium]|nr:AsmA-like C-terminal region-containing protein [Rhodospirillales bacterium]
MRRKSGSMAAAVLALAVLAGGAALVLRPDAGDAADALAGRMSGHLGLPAAAAGGARYAWTWPLRLEVPAIEIAGLGRLESIVAVDGAVEASAVFFGRVGRFSWRDGSARFDADGIAARLDGGRLAVETSLAGRPLTLAGRPAAGGIHALEIGWDGHVFAGAARYEDGLRSLAVDAAGTGVPRLRLSGRAFPAEPAFEGALVAELDGGGTAHAEFRAGGDEIDVGRFDIRTPSLSATGAARRDARRASLDLRIDDIPLAELAALAGRNTGILAGDVDLRLRIGRVSWAAGDAQGIILVAAREAGRVVVDEFAVRSIGEANLRVRDGMLVLDAPDAARFLAALGAPVERHLGGLALRGAVSVDTAMPALRVGPMDLAIAGQSLRGDVAWREGRVALSLAGDRVSLDPFVGRPMRAPPQRGPLLTRSQTARATAAAAPPEPGPGGWARAPIRLDLIGGVPVDLTLAARELVFDALAIGDARLTAAHDGAGIDLRALTGSLYGGALSASGRVDAGRATGALPRFDVTFALADAEWARLLAAFGAPGFLRGPVSVSGRLAAGGAHATALAGDLAGTLALDSPGGTVEGVDLAGLFAARTPDLAELGRRLARGGRGTFAGAKGTWQIERGRARTADTRLAAPGGTLDLAGLFDIAAWRVDMSAAFVAPGAAVVPRLALSGPPGRANVTLSAVPANAAGPPADSAARPRARAVPR